MPKELARIVVFLAVGLTSMAAYAQVENISSGSKSEEQGSFDRWLGDKYETLLARLLPKRLRLSPFPRDVKYLVVGVARDAFRTSEFWFSFEYRYDGSAMLTVRTPRGGSIAAQLREAKGKMPQAAIEDISAHLQIPERQFTDNDIPELKTLARAFEEMRISPRMPDTIISDPDSYDLWTQSQYGQEMSLALIGPGPQARRQGHPILQWMESVRSIAASHMH